MNILSPHTAPNRLSPGGLGMVVVLHLLVLWGLLRMNVITLPAQLAVLTVSLLPPAEVIQPNPEIVPPKPRPVARRPTPTPLPQPTQLAVPAESPAPTAVSPAPTFVAAPVATAPAPTQPRFDADYLDNPTNLLE